MAMACQHCTPARRPADWMRSRSNTMDACMIHLQLQLRVRWLGVGAASAKMDRFSKSTALEVRAQKGRPESARLTNRALPLPSHQENNPVPSRIFNESRCGTGTVCTTTPRLLHCLLIWFEFLDVFGYRISKLISIFWHFCSGWWAEVLLICSSGWLTWLLIIES
jgi:hypothetical protein